MRIGRRKFLASLGGVGTALGALAGASSFAQQGASQESSAISAGIPRRTPGLSEGKSGFMTLGPTGGFTERADYTKIKIPYKERNGVTWPNGARVAICFYIAAEYWEGGVAEQGQPGARTPNWNNISRTSWFNWEVGIYRAMDVFDRHGVKITALIAGLGAQYYPGVVKELAQRGHEIAGHEWDQSRPAPNLSREVERESVQRTTQILEKVSGVRPVGWINPGASSSSDTLEFLADENYLWHGDLRDDTLPYGIRYKGKMLVRTPHGNYTHNDPAVFGRNPTDFHFSPQKGFEYLKETIDAQLEWAEHEPSMMMPGVHPYFACYPDRMLTFDRFVAYVRSLPDSKVWICTYKEMAEYWKKTYLT